MTTARLMLAGGNGRLSRRPSVVLFDPTGMNTDLAARFDSADTDAEAVAGLKKHLIDSGFNAGPLVVLQWGRGELDLLVFGDIEVHTSAIAAPMVSGAGSSTWIERHLGSIELGSTSTVELWSGDAADPSTNLGLGIVACAGFRMALDFADLDAAAEAPPSEQVTPPAPDAAKPVMAEAVATVPDLTSPDQASPGPADSAASPGRADSADSSEFDAADDPFTTSHERPTAPAAEQLAPAPVAVPIAEPEAAPALPHVTPAAAPTSAVAGADQTDSQAAGDLVSSGRGGLVEAAICLQGHPSPPRSATWRVCGAELIDDQSLALIEQPQVGRIVFNDGQALVLTKAVAMGRKPESDGDRFHPLMIDHIEVSRAHAEITIDGWMVLLTDQGSRNGTWITPPNDPTPVRLDANVPHVLEHGTTVHLGGPEVSFMYSVDG